MKKITYLGNDRVPFEWEDISELVTEARKYNINIGSNCTIGSDCTIWSDCTIESGCTIGYNCTIKSDCTIGYCCTIGSDCTIESNVVISMFIGQLYRYGVFVRIEDEQTFVKMGYFDRTIEEWDADFYNNDGQFPRGSAELKLREEAYATARTIALELRKNLIK